MSEPTPELSAAEPMPGPLPFDLRPRTRPDALLEDVWPYLDMTPDERDQETRLVCRAAMNQWLALPNALRDASDWYDAWRAREGREILRRWAREYREGNGGRHDG